MIKKFENFNPDTLWTSTEEELTKYFKCDNCNAIYYKFNKIDENCKYCNSDKINQITVFEYMSLVKNRLENSEFKDEMRKKKDRDNKLVDLISTGINKEVRKIRTFIN